MVQRKYKGAVIVKKFMKSVLFNVKSKIMLLVICMFTAVVVTTLALTSVIASNRLMRDIHQFVSDVCDFISEYEEF